MASIQVDVSTARGAWLERDAMVVDTLCGTVIDPYPLCDHRCGYCQTGVQGKSVPIAPIGLIRDKLRKEIASYHPTADVSLGGISDAYPQAEMENGVTREVLEELLDRGHLVVISTKGVDGIRRDMDLITSTGRVRVLMSICTHDDEKFTKYEPFAPPPSERLKLVKDLKEAGVDARVQVAPWIPGVTDMDVILEMMGPEIPIRVYALNIFTRDMPGQRFSDEGTQAEIDEAYLAEIERIGTPGMLGWDSAPTQSEEMFYLPPTMSDALKEQLRHDSIKSELRKRNWDKKHGVEPTDSEV